MLIYYWFNLCVNQVYQVHFLKLLSLFTLVVQLQSFPDHNSFITKQAQLLSAHCILSVYSHLLSKHKLIASLFKLFFLFISPYLFQIVSYLKTFLLLSATMHFSPKEVTPTSMCINTMIPYHNCFLGVTVLLWHVRWLFTDLEKLHSQMIKNRLRSKTVWVQIWAPPLIAN